MDQTPDIIILIAGTAWLIPLLRGVFPTTPVRKEDDTS